MALEDEKLNFPAVSEQEHENNAFSHEEPTPFQDVSTTTTTIQQEQPEPEHTASPAESEIETDIETEQMELVPESREITTAPSVSEELQFSQAELESNQPSPYPSSTLQSKEQTPEIEPQEEQSSSTNHDLQSQIPTLKRKLEYEGFDDSQQQLTTSETVSRDQLQPQHHNLFNNSPRRHQQKR
ncbi:unnamed protein product [Ambrosiozyma monospora]|uniref:Unnamed protein product n=1 Tax=Ambrosiozyma monospora TaxID=43982 RepID=A0A9W6SWQ1_AMBMO|nr:unnamed protein product [Ambrosiozyma monospora]